MAITRTMIAKQKQDASRRKRSKTCENDDDSASWSYMFHDILVSIIFRLGVIDFIAFSGVCKSWRTVALLNRKMFMLSRQPMHICLSTRETKKKACYLEDIKGRKFTTILPRSSNRTCIGFICGYLILFGSKTYDFRLVNPITSHELHFPYFPFHVVLIPESFRCTLVFSPTMSTWVFVISVRHSSRISFSFPGKQATWTHLYSDLPIIDIYFFQGKVYALGIGLQLYEVRLNPTPILLSTVGIGLSLHLTELQMKNFIKSELINAEFATLDEKLHVIGHSTKDKDKYKTVEVDFDQMRWLHLEKALKEYACLASSLVCGSTKLEFWTDPGEQYEGFGSFRSTNEFDYKRARFTKGMWYFPHKCLDVNILHERMIE